MAPSGSPVAYLITQDIKTTLEAIAEGAEYYTTVEAVHVADRPIGEVHEFPAIIVNPPSYSLDIAGDNLTEARTGTLEYDIVIIDQTREDPEQELANFVRDVDKALRADIGRGGNAVWTRVERIEPFYPQDTNDPYVVALFEVRVSYRTEHDDLNTAV